MLVAITANVLTASGFMPEGAGIAFEINNRANPMAM
jgi:hypothetical protein